MLRQVAIRRVFQAVGIFSSLEDNEEETDMEEQDLDSRNVDDGNDRLKVRWFSEIPRCSFQCLYPPALSCGCYYYDFNCICRSIPVIAADQGIEACMNSCPVNPDQRWTPSRILDFCELVGEDIQLPEYMAQFAGLHRRQDDQVSHSDGGYYSTASHDDSVSYSDGGYLVTVSYDDSGSSLQPATATSYTPASATATTSTSSETITSSATSTTTRSASTDTASFSSSSDISAGAKAGIGVAIPLVVIILGLFLLWYFRKRRANRRNGVSNNIPETSQQPWPGKSSPEKTSPESNNLPAEADSIALHEPDSTSVFESPSLAAGTQKPGVYELSGNSAIEYPPAAAFATQKYRTSLGHHSSKTYLSLSKDVSREAVTSSPSTLASAMIPSGGLDASICALTDSGTPLQNPQGKTWEGTERPSSGVEVTDAQLAQLEAEMARIAEERERLQKMQALADRETELKRQIAARKAANSGAKPDGSL